MYDNQNLRIDGVEKLYDFCKVLKLEKIYEHPLFISINELFDKFPPFDLRQNEIVYRARKVKPFENIKTYDDDPISFIGFGRKDSFIPPKENISKNRANFIGNPVLYVSTSMNTAIAETRPYKGNRISIAEIIINKDLKLFDLALPPGHIGVNFMYDPPYDDFYSNTLDDLEANYLNLKDKIACMFAIPYEYIDNNEYLPTQYITEYIRNSKQFDGIRYTSSLSSSEGENITIFNCNNEDDCQCKNDAYILCEPRSSSLYNIENIGYFARSWNAFNFIACPSWAWKK